MIRVSGPDALSIADKVVTCRKGKISDAAGYTIKFGTVLDESGAVLDEVLVSVFRSPHSYTGENSVEISCHASSYIASGLMNLLYAAGARAAEPGEFTQRAFLNGKMDLAQAEAVADVIASQNAAAHRIAFKQMKGGFSSELRRWSSLTAADSTVCFALLSITSLDSSTPSNSETPSRTEFQLRLQALPTQERAHC